ncbi:MAG TPA: HDOD domain-containing protein [Rhodanobacter sp.]
MPAPDGQPTAAPAVPPAAIKDDFYRFVLSAAGGGTDELSTLEHGNLKQLELLSTRFDIRSLPRLPTVLPQLLRALKADRAGGGELARLIGRDPLMVGEVMRVTNSAHYRLAQPVSSLQHAVVLLGQEGLHRVLTQHAMKPILQSSGGAFGQAAGERLWQHAERCAHACAWLGRHNGCDAFEAYLAGIVCHAGDGAVVRLLDHLKLQASEAPSIPFLAACADLASRLSSQVAKYWELPRRVVHAVSERQQHATPATSPLGKALAVADLLAMAHLLVENRLFEQSPDFSSSWPGLFTPNLLARCQQDLLRHFPVEPTAA